MLVLCVCVFFTFPYLLFDSATPFPPPPPPHPPAVPPPGSPHAPPTPPPPPPEPRTQVVRRRRAPHQHGPPVLHRRLLRPHPQPSDDVFLFFPPGPPMGSATAPSVLDRRDTSGTGAPRARKPTLFFVKKTTRAPAGTSPGCASPCCGRPRSRCTASPSAFFFFCIISGARRVADPKVRNDASSPETFPTPPPTLFLAIFGGMPTANAEG